jgi:hypothetical protein
MPPTAAPTELEDVCEPRLFVVRAGPRGDPFAELVRQVRGDPGNAYSIERYLWVLEEAPPEPCDQCGRLFLPSFNYDGDSARGRPRRYCSMRCAQRMFNRRRPPRLRRTRQPQVA